MLHEWRIRDIENKAQQAISRLYELDTLRSDVGSLEHSNRELRSEVARLRSELQTITYEIELLKQENE